MIYGGRYQRVEYVQSSGSQYIDTGIKPNEHLNTLRIEADMQYVTVPTDNASHYLFGTGYYNSTAANRRTIAAGYYYSGSKTKTSYFNAGGAFSTGMEVFTNSTMDANRHLYGIDQVNSNYLFDDLTQSFSGTINSNLSLPILVFCGRASGTSGAPANYYSTARCYGFKVYDNDVLIADFVPVRDLMSSAGGLYDLLSDSMKAANGALTFGSDVFEVTASVSPTNGGSVLGVGFYPVGTSVQLEAEANNRFKFIEWGDGEMANPRTITVTADVSYLAKFRKQAGEMGDYFVVYGKKRKALHQKATFYSEVISAEISEDLLQPTSSTIVCLNDASYLAEGDVVFLRDNRGNEMFAGVVASIENNVIHCGQMQSFYKINYYAMPDTSNEKSAIGTPYTAATMLHRYLMDVKDGHLCSRFTNSGGAWTYLVGSDVAVYHEMGRMDLLYSAWDSSLPSIPFRTEDETLDLEQFIYDVYSMFGIITLFDVKLDEYPLPATYSTGASTCFIFEPIHGFYRGNDYIIDPYPEYSFGDNSEFITNINVVSEGDEYNALMIFNSSNTTYRGGYSIYNNDGYGYDSFPGPSVMSNYRLSPVKAKVVSSDDELTEIRDAELSLLQYNHKVNFTMLFKNNFYDFFDLKLGQKFNFYVGNKLYKSLLTGWKYYIESGKKMSSVDLTCGKVRTSLTSKLNRGR